MNNNNLVKILVGVSIVLSLGALIFTGITLYNFNKSMESLAIESKENVDNQDEQNKSTDTKTDSQETNNKTISDTNKETKEESNNETSQEKTTERTNILTSYIESVKDVKGLQPDVIAYLNHEVDQFKDKELPNEDFPSSEDYDNSQKNELIQTNLIEQLMGISSDSKELDRVHRLLLDAEKRIKDYYKYCGESENSSTAQSRAIQSLNIANIKFKEYKDAFKKLCETNNADFETNWSLMFPEPKELVTQKPVILSEKDTTTIPSKNNDNTNNDNNNNNNNSNSDGKVTLIGRWLGDCPDNQHDADYELELFDDGTFTKRSSTLTFYGTYTFSSSKRVKFTYDKQTIKSDTYSSTKDLNETFTTNINYLENGKISFDDGYHFGCDHGSYIFTKDE